MKERYGRENEPRIRREKHDAEDKKEEVKS